VRQDETMRCSFCGSCYHDVPKLIAGATAYICNECIEICKEILADDDYYCRTREGP
jgi:ATP-dependent Clp protease ATP-binding subunit ClpX